MAAGYHLYKLVNSIKVKTANMKVIVEKLQYLVGELTGYGLLNEQETQYALVPTSENFVFGQQLAFADSLHLHIHVANIDNLPQALFKIQF